MSSIRHLPLTPAHTIKARNVLLSEKSRSAMYTNLSPIVGDEAISEMLSSFPLTEDSTPLTRDFLRAELAERFAHHELRFDTKLDTLEDRFDTKLETLEGRIDTKLDTLEERMLGRFTEVDARFTQVDDRFDRVDARFTQVDDRFDRVDARFTQVDDRFDRVDRRLDRVDDRFDKVDDQFAAMRQANRQLAMWVVSAATALAGVIIAFVQFRP